MNTIQDPSTVSLEDFGSNTKNDESADTDSVSDESENQANKIIKSKFKHN